jgi:uncharacterized protein (TIGR02597 family)
MKSFMSYSFLAAVAATGLALGDTATTTPVGYISLGNTAAGVNNVPANSDVVVSVPMLKSAVFAGKVASTGASTLTVSGTPAFTVNSFTSVPHVLVVESGAKSGLIVPITSNTADTLTVALGFYSLSGILATDSVSIRPAWTVSSFMAGATSLTGVQLLAYSNTQQSVNNSADGLYFYVGTGWENADGDSANNTILYPGEGFIVRTSGTPIADFVVSGEVPKAKSYIAVGQSTTGARDSVISYVSPTTEALGSSGLGISNGDILLDFDNTTSGQNKSGVPYFFVNGAWENADGDSAATFQLIGGKSYIYRRATAATTGYTILQDTQTYVPSL